MLRTRVKAGRVTGVVLAAMLAVALVTIQSIELLVASWQPQAGRPTSITLRLPLRAELHVPTAAEPQVVARLVWHPTLLVPRGQVPTAEAMAIFDAHRADRRLLRPTFFLGLGAIYFLTAVLLVTFVRRYSSPRGNLLRTQLGLLGLVLLVFAGAKALLLFSPLPEFWVPAAAVPLWAALHTDRRPAFVLSLGMSFLVGSLLGFDITLIAVMLACCLGGTVAFRDWKRPRSMVAAGFVGGVSAALMFLAMRFYLVGGFGLRADLALGWRGVLAACVGGGLAAGLIAWVLQGVIGLALGVVSRARLLDLADVDQPLLRQLAEQAPGTWEHSRAMANLAEAASAAIGANALLTRVGAYYHDVGKTVQPKYFVENLTTEERSPHEDLEPEVSADAIMVHVVEGARILRDARIPEPVVEFAYSHHGTSVIEYFWHKCQEQGNPNGLTADAFRYPGIRPQSRETAILMLVDGIEAAARTIEEPSLDRFEEMIQRVVFSKLRQGQLDESGLTIEELRVLANTLAQTLVNVYHHRIKYPWQRDGTADGGAPHEAPPAPEAEPEPEAPATEAPPASEPAQKAS